MAEKLRIGVFGAYRGMTMIRVLLDHPDATLVAICDKFVPALEKAKKAADEAGLKNLALYENFEDFFKHDMDAVVLANYANEHAPYAIRLLKSGRHVLSEVLPCQNMAEAVALIEAVEETARCTRTRRIIAIATIHSRCGGAMSAAMSAKSCTVRANTFTIVPGIWPEITYGEKDHWRNNMFPTFYCTHSLGPLLTISGRRPVSVVGLVTNRNYVDPPQGNRNGNAAGLEMVTLDNGAVLKSIHGNLKREPGSVNYEVYGMKGSMESERFLPSYAEKEQKPQIQVYVQGEELCKGECERYVPEKVVAAKLAEHFSTHGGSDFYATHLFIEKILGREEGIHYSIDVYRAVDMGICGILAYRSILAGGVPVKVPDLRNPEERDAYRQ